MTANHDATLAARADELRSAIAVALHISAVDLLVSPMVESSSYQCWWLEQTSGRKARRLFVKDWGYPLLRKSHPRIRLQRELYAYSEILTIAPWATPRFVCAVPKNAPVWLVVEAVDGQPLRDGTTGSWYRAGKWLAEFQSWLVTQSFHLPAFFATYDAAYLRSEAERAARAVAERTPRWHPELGSSIAKYTQALDRMDDHPTTIVHGSYRELDILATESEIYPVDWERIGVGPPLFDLGYLTAAAPEEKADAAISGYAAAADRMPDATNQSLALFQIHGWMAKLRKAAREGNEERVAVTSTKISSLAEQL